MYVPWDVWKDRMEKNIKDQNQWIPPRKLNVSLKSCLETSFCYKKKNFSTFNLFIQKLF